MITAIATIYLGFTKYNVRVRCRALVDVWLGDDKQDVLRLPDGDPRHSCYLTQTQLGHGLVKDRKETRHKGTWVDSFKLN